MVDLKPNRLLVNLTHKKLWLTFNPWEYLISPYNIDTELHINVMRIKATITN